MAKRVTSIGGQALLEGILMVGPKKNVAAFCDEAGKNLESIPIVIT